MSSQQHFLSQTWAGLVLGVRVIRRKPTEIMCTIDVPDAVLNTGPLLTHSIPTATWFTDEATEAYVENQALVMGLEVQHLDSAPTCGGEFGSIYQNCSPWTQDPLPGNHFDGDEAKDKQGYSR